MSEVSQIDQLNSLSMFNLNVPIDTDFLAFSRQAQSPAVSSDKSLQRHANPQMQCNSPYNVLAAPILPT